MPNFLQCIVEENNSLCAGQHYTRITQFAAKHNILQHYLLNSIQHNFTTFDLHRKTYFTKLHLIHYIALYCIAFHCISTVFILIVNLETGEKTEQCNLLSAELKFNPLTCDFGWLELYNVETIIFMMHDEAGSFIYLEDTK